MFVICISQNMINRIRGMKNFAWWYGLPTVLLKSNRREGKVISHGVTYLRRKVAEKACQTQAIR